MVYHVFIEARQVSVQYQISDKTLAHTLRGICQNFDGGSCSLYFLDVQKAFFDSRSQDLKQKRQQKSFFPGHVIKGTRSILLLNKAHCDTKKIPLSCNLRSLCFFIFLT